MIPLRTPLIIKFDAIKASKKYFKLAITSLHTQLIEIIDRIYYK